MEKWESDSDGGLEPRSWPFDTLQGALLCIIFCAPCQKCALGLTVNIYKWCFCQGPLILVRAEYLQGARIFIYNVSTTTKCCNTRHRMVGRHEDQAGGFKGCISRGSANHKKMLDHQLQKASEPLHSTAARSRGPRRGTQEKDAR